MEERFNRRPDFLAVLLKAAGVTWGCGGSKKWLGMGFYLMLQ